jgi:hypothetical protein
MSTGSTATPSKRVELNHYGPATITHTVNGFRVVTERGATADFTVDRGDIQITAFSNCDRHFMHAALSAACNAERCRRNPAQPTVAPPAPVRTPAEERAFEEAMEAHEGECVEYRLGRTYFGAR